jgi:hypothetical protein
MKKFLAAASAAGRCSTARVHISAIVVLHIIISVTAVTRPPRARVLHIIISVTARGRGHAAAAAARARPPPRADNIRQYLSQPASRI